MISDKAKQFISIVIYLYNNEKTIKQFLLHILDFCENSFSNSEIILVNDSSDDLTVKYVHEVLRDLPPPHPPVGPVVTIVNTSGHHGIEMAMTAGTDLAIGDIIFEFEGVNGIAEELPLIEAYKKLISGFDIVSAVPEKIHSVSSIVFYNIFNQGFGKRITPITRERFRIVSRRALNRIKALNNYIPYRKVLYAQCGLPSTRVFFREKHGVKTEKISNRINLAIDSLLLFTDTIQRISSVICYAFGFFALVVGIYITVGYFGINKPVEGWAPLMGFLAAGFFGIFLLFSFAFKYLSIILSTVFVKQRYIISSIEKI